MDMDSPPPLLDISSPPDQIRRGNGGWLGRRRNGSKKAIKHPGALKRWLKREHPHLLKKNGEIAWTKLREWFEKHKDELTEHRKRQIQLALTLHKLAMRRKRK